MSILLTRDLPLAKHLQGQYHPVDAAAYHYDKRVRDMRCQSGRYVAIGDGFDAAKVIKRRQSRCVTSGGWREALEGQSSWAALALHDRTIQLLAAVHLKLAEVGDSLPAGERHRLQPLTSILVQFEAELRSLAGMPATSARTN